MRCLRACLFQEFLYRLIEQNMAFLHKDDMCSDAIEFTKDMTGNKHEFALLLLYLLLEDIG